MYGRLIRWGLLLGLLLAAAGGLAYMAARGRETDESWIAAQQAVADYDFAGAQRHLVDYVTRWRKDSLGHLELARCYRRAPAADFESASEQIARAKELGGHGQFLQLESDLLEFQRRGRPRELEERLGGYLESQPENAPLILEALARGAIMDRRLNTANKWLDLWVRDYPDDLWARLWRGTLFQHMDRPQLAIEDYRIVLDQQPDDPEVSKRLGLVLAVSGYDFDEAETLLGAYLDSKPDDLYARAAIARCQRAGGRPEEALETTKQILRADAKHEDALLTKALSELDLDSPQDAWETVRELKKLARQARSEQADQRLRALQPVMQHPHLTQRAEEILHLEAKVLSRMGRADEARDRLQALTAMQADVAQLKKLLALHPQQQDDADLTYQILQLYLKIDKPREAEAWLRRLELVNAGDPRISAVTEEIRQRK